MKEWEKWIRMMVRMSLRMRGYLLVGIYSEIGKRGKRVDVRKILRMMRGG